MPDHQEVRERDRARASRAEYGSDLIVDLSEAHGIEYAAHHRIPLLIVMYNNRSYYNDEEHQILTARARNRPAENAHIGQRMEDPPVDFAGMAKAFGIEAWGRSRILPTSAWCWSAPCPMS